MKWTAVSISTQAAINAGDAAVAGSPGARSVFQNGVLQAAVNHRLTAGASVSARSVGRWTSHGDATPPQLSRVGRRYSCHACGLGSGAAPKVVDAAGRISNFPKSRRPDPKQQRAGRQDTSKRVREEMLAAHLLYQPEESPMPPTKARDALRREWEP